LGQTSATVGTLTFIGQIERHPERSLTVAALTGMLMDTPLAYFISFHTYGTWLHGHERGSVDWLHDVYGEPFVPPNAEREQAMSGRMTEDALLFDEPQRIAVQESIVGTVHHRQWRLDALHVRTTHVHSVVQAPEATPEKVVNDFKTYATRGLRQRSLVGPRAKVRGRHGSTRYLWTLPAWRGAIKYTCDDQGAPLTPPPIRNDSES
jgi:REP element-mobilizing transposase RayT